MEPSSQVRAQALLKNIQQCSRVDIPAVVAQALRDERNAATRRCIAAARGLGDGTMRMQDPETGAVLKRWRYLGDVGETLMQFIEEEK